MRFCPHILFILLANLTIFQVAPAALNVYVSAPGSQTIDATILGASTEDFNATRTNGNNANVGTYVSTVSGVTYTKTSGTVQFQPNDIYGGYLQGNYLGVSSNSSVTISLATPRQYLGIYYTAADANNTLEIYSGTTLLLSFSTATLTNFLPNNPTSTVTAINGNVYNTKDYYGQPTSGSNPTESYAYLSFVGTAGTTYDKVVMTQGGTAIFETDNHSFRTVAPSIPLSYVVIIPEPSTSWMIALGGLGVFLIKRRKLV